MVTATLANPNVTSLLPWLWEQLMIFDLLPLVFSAPSGGEAEEAQPVTPPGGPAAVMGPGFCPPPQVSSTGGLHWSSEPVVHMSTSFEENVLLLLVP